MKTTRYFGTYLAQFLLECEMFQNNILDGIKPSTLFQLLFPENRGVCEIMWINIVQLGRSQMTI
jgi:hypothetical protein